MSLRHPPEQPVGGYRRENLSTLVDRGSEEGVLMISSEEVI